MPINTYPEAIDWLFAQFPSYQNIGSAAYKPGLENVRLLCKALGNPQEKLKCIHIAGSNGKGSTASMLASYLTENDLRVGLFTSPHLVDFRERIRINGTTIDENQVVLFCKRIQALQLTFEPSFFEISFTMALDYFVSSGCDVCVIETGLGGRLDATNIITPLLSIITTISLEHTQFLGNTLAEVAFEKAGIIKPKVPVVIGQKRKETEDVFRQKAKETDSSLFFVDEAQFPHPNDFPLLGDYQLDNYKTVVLATQQLQGHFSLREEKMHRALAKLQENTGFQARMQVMSSSPRVVFDVSHNAEGIEATLQFFKKEMKGTTLHIVYGSSADKNFDEIFPLFPKDAHYYLTEFENFRSAKKIKLEEQAKAHALQFDSYLSAKEALTSAKKNANLEDTILVFGSFFLLHDFLK